ncbi:MAG TPA: class III lanthionine synthetase LanKC [Candidatus Angelobacter sp.]|nr:class III lanthionine synthetase LanKC [Candidatus Angelobacter sp.]
MRTRENILYTLVNREFYETLSHYEPNVDEYISLVKGLLGPEWVLRRGDVWMQCASPKSQHPAQGWKIHISAIGENAVDILKSVVPILKGEDTSFKFALDLRMLLLLNSKTWYRGGSGKFITIYPPGEQQFLRLLEMLHPATSHFEGPYILSDRRYKNNKILFYRYGGLQRMGQFGIKGERSTIIRAPNGTDFADERVPFFQLPPWVSDPFPPDPQDEEALGTLKKGRYLIEQTFSISNAGGIYLATDSTSGQKVIIKEARPWTNWMLTGEDAVALLNKEHRLLKKLEDVAICPKVIDFFQDWEHYFLVEEYLTGLSLRNYSTIRNLALEIKLTMGAVDEFYKNFRSIFVSLARCITLLHEHGIIFSDLSPNNVIIDVESLQCRIIDFEAAYEMGKDRAIRMFTPGYAQASDFADNKLTVESDYYALGALMLSYLMPINPILDLKPSANKEWLDSIAAEIGVPADLYNTILELMNSDPSKRPSAAVIADKIREPKPIAYGARSQEPEPQENLRRVILSARDYMLATADPSRVDRLFPADAKVFSTNPLSLAHGACGSVLALKYVTGEVPNEILQWIVQQEIDPLLYPPGLYLGMSGIAWSLFEFGFEEQAERIMMQTHTHPLLDASMDIFYGIAGWGLANLYFFLKTDKTFYLDGAIKAADVLCRRAEKDENANLYWRAAGDIPLGLAEGGSGIALFLLYVSLASGNESYLSAGKKALQFDLSHGIQTKDGGLSWPFTTDPGNRIILPYWRHGSAGVGSTVLRFHKLFGDDSYRSVLEKIHIDTDRKYSVTCGFFTGLAGIGEFLLDSYDFMQDGEFLKRAYRVAEGIKLFAIRREQGVAFPARGLTRISCDYGTGSAGIILFLNRLLTGSGFTIFLDDLLDRRLACSRFALDKDAFTKLAPIAPR